MSRFSFLLLGLSLAACGDKDTDDTASSSTDDTAGTEGTDVCTEPAEVECLDALISDLSLHDDKVFDGDIDEETDGDDFVTTVDASAGGYGNETRNPWVYIKFTPDGVEQVEIDDESALEDMEWDMALRRFIVRLNGGSSGPSCVGAATLLETAYDDLTEVPEGLTFSFDDYYTSDCTIINDSSGLPNSPQVVLSSWWDYPGCVATTGYPHLIQRKDGSVLKLVVEEYYASGQEKCNNNGTPGSDSGMIKMRWQFLETAG